jgi:N-acyl-D-amino-acid deacylase
VAVYQLLIRGGKVLDGTGNPWTATDLGIQEGRISLLHGDTSNVQALRVIDASGYVVCPGFIDMHSHSGMVSLHTPPHEAKVRQGVTTELIGVDGLSPAPFVNEHDFDSFMDLVAGLDGRPPKNFRWGSVTECLEILEQYAVSNLALVIGNSTLRIAAMGWREGQPTLDEAHLMAETLRNAIREGAFGLSTGLTYPPGSYADASEILELCRVTKQEGGIYVTHPRYTLGDRHFEPYREAIEISRQSGCPLHISHLHSPHPGGSRSLLGLLDDARLEGVDVTFDSYPYPYTSGPLLALLPSWTCEGGIQALMRRLRSKHERARIALDPDVAERDYSLYLLTNFTKSKYRFFEGHSLASVAVAMGKSTVETLCELLLTERMGLSYVGLNGNPVNVRSFYRHPVHMVASAGLMLGPRLNPRSYGSYPMVLGDFCREEQVLGLSDAVRKMTGMPAQRLGLRGRGLLLDGYAADIVLFDPLKVASRATLGNPLDYPDGIDYVIVNGTMVIDRGRFTGALPGRALYHDGIPEFSLPGNPLSPRTAGD